ncbi:hypothetical protein SUDANB145_07311 (plasmid) [Streptomyces sp. enrichment culture]|uniref:hypothetical protein n=1 Tax=Streptomyces sp. enrichment culture TaxID=1795815 RepID=UPI003F558FD9
MAGSIRARLASAVSTLKEAGAYDEAAAVEAVTASRGWLLLKNSEAQRASTSTLTLTVTSVLKKALVNAGEEFGAVFSGLAEEAYRLVLDGEWVPAKPVRTPYGSGGGQAVLNLSLDAGLRQRVQEMLPALSERAGYRVTESNIALSYICDELGVERPNAGDRESLEMRFPVSLIGHWERSAEEQGVSLRQVVEEAIPKLLDGSWVPDRSWYMTTSERGPRTQGFWSEDQRQRLWLPVDKELLSGLRSKAGELTQQSGVLVYPGTVVRAILTDRFGDPAA